MNKIIILQGGENEEHNVSLNTSIQMQKSLKKLHYNFQVLNVQPMNFKKKIQEYDKSFFFLNALHGPFGEDGEIQKILEKKRRWQRDCTDVHMRGSCRLSIWPFTHACSCTGCGSSSGLRWFTSSVRVCARFLRSDGSRRGGQRLDDR